MILSGGRDEYGPYLGSTIYETLVPTVVLYNGSPFLRSWPLTCLKQ
jgi:hypothetical protein